MKLSCDTKRWHAKQIFTCTCNASRSAKEEVIRNVLLAAQPTKKFVTVEQVAALTAFLCSVDAASITGAVLPIEGGWTAQ